MIDLREIEGVKDEGYLIIKEADGTEIRVQEPKQKDFMRLVALQHKVANIEEKYRKVLKLDEDEEIKINKLTPLYEELVSEIYNMFLFIINLNTAGKKFTIDQINFIGLENIKSECEGYVSYINSKLKK